MSLHVSWNERMDGRMLGAMDCDGVRWIAMGCDGVRCLARNSPAVHYPRCMLSRPPLDAMPKSIRSYMSSSSSLIHQSSSSCVCTVVAFVGVGVCIWVWFCIIYGCCVISIQTHMNSIFLCNPLAEKKEPAVHECYPIFYEYLSFVQLEDSNNLNPVLKPAHGCAHHSFLMPWVVPHNMSRPS